MFIYERKIFYSVFSSFCSPKFCLLCSRAICYKAFAREPKWKKKAFFHYTNNNLKLSLSKPKFVVVFDFLVSNFDCSVFPDGVSSQNRIQNRIDVFVNVFNQNGLSIRNSCFQNIHVPAKTRVMSLINT